MEQEELKSLQAGRDLDLRIVNAFLGGCVTGDPEDWSPKEEVWFWEHSHDGVLIGEPYLVTGPGEPKQYSHSWRKFHPSTDIADAWIVFSKMRPEDHDEPDYWSIANMGEEWVAISIWAHHDGDIPNFDIRAPTAPLAICRAALYSLTGPTGELNAGSTGDLRPVG